MAQTCVVKPNIYEKESERNSNIYFSKVWIQLLQTLVHAVISTTVLSKKVCVMLHRVLAFACRPSLGWLL